eukprot:g13394.t1
MNLQQVERCARPFVFQGLAKEASLCDGCTLQLVWLQHGHCFATASTDTTAALWSVETGERVQLFEGHEDQVMWLCFSADGQLLATSSTDRTAKVWCADSGECLTTLRGHKGPVFAVAFSPNGASLASCSHDRRSPRARARGRPGHDGHFPRDPLVPSQKDKQIKVWDLQGNELLTLTGHSKQIFSVAWTPDGETLASSSDDATIRLWHVASQSCHKVIYGHTGAAAAGMSCLDSEDGAPELSFVHEWVRHALFSPDGLKVITSVSDNTAMLWDALSGTPLLSFQGHNDWIRNASFSSDGLFVATASKDACAKVWRLDGPSARSSEVDA